jgi:short-subunit dehydrogenase
VITGSSDGIGREFAIQLGSAGLNILLVARNKEALETVAEKISACVSFSSQCSLSGLTCRSGHE